MSGSGFTDDKFYRPADTHANVKLWYSHNEINNNDNDTNTGGTNEFISFSLQSLVTRGERHKS